MNRKDELAANLAAVNDRIAAACSSAGRDPAEVRLVAVTKTFPASDVRLLAGLGVVDVAENRDQEAAPKAAECRDIGLTWHFVGQLQTNKARSVASYASVIHSVDRVRLVRALSHAVSGRTLTCLIQVSLDSVYPRPTAPNQHGIVGAEGRSPGEPSESLGLLGERGGVLPSGVPEVAEAILAAPGLELGGVMAVAPLGADPVPAFARLASVAADVRAVHPDAKIISAGMSGDLEQAIAGGATHVRIGTALLGGRRAIVR